MTVERKPQARRLKTREALLQAARVIVADQGYARLRVEDVVAAAGTAKGTLFAHFPDREFLIASLVAEQFTDLLEEAAADVASIADLGQHLQPFLDLMTEDLQVIGALVRFSGPEPDHAGTGIYRAMCRQADWLTASVAALQNSRAARTSHSATVLANCVQAVLFQAAVTELCSNADGGESLRQMLDAVLAPVPVPQA